MEYMSILDVYYILYVLYSILEGCYTLVAYSMRGTQGIYISKL